MRPLFSYARLALLALGLAGCGADRGDGIPEAHAAPAGVVDSVLPVEESLRRFRAGAPDPGVLGGGFASRDSLAAAFGRALFRGDTATLAGLLIDRAEFAWLYYPDSPFAREPYDLDPEIVWLQTRNGTDRGITRALRRLAGQGHRYLGTECEPEPAVQGANRLWEECAIVYETRSGERRRARLFGSILERDGRVKFVSYSNPL